MVKRVPLSTNKQIGLLANDKTLIQSIIDILPSIIVRKNILEVVSSLALLLIDGDAGYDLDQIIRLTEAKSIPTLLLTNATSENLEKALKIGITDYILKPIIPHLLEHRLHQILKQNAPSNHIDTPNGEYQTILASMSDPIFVFDSHGTYLRIPSVNATTYYKPPEQLVGKQLHEVFSKEIADLFTSTIQKSLTTRLSQVIEYELPTEDGNAHFSAVVNPIAGKDEVVWVSRDITSTMLSEKTIIETEQRYQQLFENANDMLLIVDLKTGQLLEANKQVEKQLGYTQQELKQLKISDIEEPMQDTKSRVVTRTLTSSGHIIFEQNYRRQDGKSIPVETSTRVIDYHGQKVLLSFARNIKQRKLAMQAEAEERFFAEVLRDTIAQLSRAFTMDDVLTIVISTVAQIVKSDRVTLMLVEDENAKVVLNRGYQMDDSQPKSMPIASVFTLSHMYETHQPLIIANTQNDTRWSQFKETNWTQSYIGAPIVLKEEVIGFVNLASNAPNHFTNKHKQRLQVFTDQVAIAIENVQLYEANQRYTEDLEAIVVERTSELTKANNELREQILKRQEVEEKLSEERNILRTIIDSLPVTVYVKNRESKFTLANRFPYIRIKEQPFIGRSDLEIVDDKTLAKATYDKEQRIMEHGTTLVEEEYFVTEDGNEHWNVITQVPLRDDNKDVVGLVGVKQDITQVKLAERQLLQLLSSANCLLWSATVEYDNQDFHWSLHVENETSARQFLQFNEDIEDYTQAWLDSIAPDDQILRKTIAQTHLQHNQKNYKLEYHCITADDKEHWLNEDVQIRQLAPNRWHLVGVSLDISDIKSATFALREAYEQMEQSVIDRTEELQQANQELQQEIVTRQKAEVAERKQRILAEALQKSITALNNTLDIDDVLDTVLSAMKSTVDHDASNIMLLNGNTLTIARQNGYPSPLPISIPLDSIEDVPIVYETKQPIIIQDTHTYDMWDAENVEKHGEIRWIRSNIKIPIIYDENVIGILMLDSTEPNKFTQDHAHLLQTFANQASIALENARLYQEEHKQRLLAETLQDSLKALNNTLDTDAVLDAILNSIQQNVEHEAANIILFEHNILRVVRQRGYPNGLPTSIPVQDFKDIKYVKNSKEPFIIHDTQSYEAWAGLGDVGWVRCNIKVPILQDGYVIGIINLDSSEPNKYTLEHATLLQAFANQASIALQNARLYQQAQDEIAERKRAEDAERQQRIFAETLRDTAILINQNLNTHDLYETIIEAISQVIKVHDTVSIITIDPDNHTGIVVKDMGFEDFGGTVVGLQIDFNNSEAKTRLFDQRSPLFIQDTYESDIWIDLPETRWIRSHIGLPIYIQDDIMALINIDSQYPNTFTEQHIEQLSVFSHQVAIALQNAHLVGQIQRYANELEYRVKQRTAELEHERLLLQLEQSQLRAILDAMREGVYYMNNKHKMIYINNALAEMTGYSTENWLSGKAFEEINRNANIERDELWEDIEEHLKSNHFYHNEGLLTRADGSTFDASLTRTEVKDLDDKRVGIVTVMRDISHEKQLAKRQSRFIANAAHELRTPITNIKTRLYLMKHKPDNMSEYLEIIESSANWMQTLVDNLFDQSRFERGIIQLHLEDVILQDLAQLIIDTQQPQARSKNIQIIKDWHEFPIVITADESRLRQVITNLINNAIAYTPEGGQVKLSLHKDLSSEENIVMISVQDTGIGIEHEHLPYLFQPFYRATDDTNGAGLGLSISREIILAHKGEIQVESQVKIGTTFHIYLPILTEKEILGEV